MFGLDGAALTFIQTVLMGIIGLISAVLVGYWQNRRQARKDAMDGGVAQRQSLSKDQQDHLANVERDRDYQAKQAEICQTDRAAVWLALTKLSEFAHTKVRHEAIRVIFNHEIEKGTPRDQLTRLEEIPSTMWFYNEAKKELRQ